MELLRQIGLWRNSSAKTPKDIKTTDQLIEFMGFKIGEQMAEGSYGKIYKVQYKEAKLAVKVMDGRKVENDDEDVDFFKTNFLPREIDAITKLKHKHICAVFKIFNEPQKIYIFMEHIKGGTLLDKVKKSGVISEAKARYYFSQLLDVMIYLHDLQLSHRDLKLENIMIDSQDKIKLVDFGFCRITVTKDDRRILSRTTCGSTPYMSPEMLSSEPYNPLLCDTWGLGVVLFTMVAGKFPFPNDDDIEEQHERQQSKVWDYPHIFKRSKEFYDIIDCMLEPDVSQRWETHRLLNHPWMTKEE